MVFGRKKKKKKYYIHWELNRKLHRQIITEKNPTQKEKSKGRIEEINKERSVRHT